MKTLVAPLYMILFLLKKKKKSPSWLYNIIIIILLWIVYGRISFVIIFSFSLTLLCCVKYI